MIYLKNKNIFQFCFQFINYKNEDVRLCRKYKCLLSLSLSPVNSFLGSYYILHFTKTKVRFLICKNIIYVYVQIRYQTAHYQVILADYDPNTNL